MKDRGIKLCLVLYFLGMAGAFLLLRNSPTQGYELSIYKHTPLMTTIFLIATTVAGIWMVAYHAFSSSRSKWWVVGYGMLLFNMFAVLSLPYLRGYYYYMHADPVAHWAWVQEMLATHHIHPGNIYPVLHLDLVNIS